MDKALIGNRVRRQRESLAMTRDQFAELIEISPQFLAEIENGKKGMSAETLYKISSQTGASADYILLGKQFMGDTATPAAKLIEAIPLRYSEAIEDLLRAFIKGIAIADDEVE